MTLQELKDTAPVVADIKSTDDCINTMSWVARVEHYFSSQEIKTEPTKNIILDDCFICMMITDDVTEYKANLNAIIARIGAC